ncbi:MAG: AI-2E family transporter [Nitrospirae bacterium]|nr:AI-2E family transporter [Nitrospirota bacterium]
MIANAQFFTLLLLAITLLVFYLSYLVLEPFLAVLAWAVALAIAAAPLHRRITRLFGGRRGWGSLAATLLITLLLVVPVGFLLGALVQEILDTYRWVEEQARMGRFEFLIRFQDHPFLLAVRRQVGQYIDLGAMDAKSLVLEPLKAASGYFLSQGTALLKNFTLYLLGTVLMLITLFFLFRDGEQLTAWVQGVIPLPAERKAAVFAHLQGVIEATVLGGLVVAMVQGTLGGLAFWVLGLPSPVLWGTVMAVLSFVPLGGTALVWFPAAVILLLEGFYVRGGILIGYGFLVIGLADNLLRPILISGRTRLHPLLIFFGILGGIRLFGLLGVVAGPLLLAVALTLVEVYRESEK